MRHWKWAVWALLPLLTFLGSGAAAASVDQVTVDIGVMIASGATLTLGTNAINFPQRRSGYHALHSGQSESGPGECVVTGLF